MKLRDVIWVLFISMLPLIELRGAIPVGSVLGLPFYINYALAVVGNLLPVPFILLFIPEILDFLAKFKFFRPVVLWLYKKAYKNRAKIDKAQEGANASDIENGENLNTGYDLYDELPKIASLCGKAPMPTGAFIGLLLFVLLPLPGTGAWTGALVASLFGFPRLKSMLAITLGVLGCGVIMCLASYGVLGFLSFLL